MRKKRFTIGAALMLALLAAVAAVNVTFFAATEYYNKQLGDLNAMQSKYAKFSEVSAIVDKYFVGEYDEETAMDEAMAGYIYGLGDRWSGYYTKEQTEAVMADSENTYYGIGVTVSFSEEDMYTIIGVADGGPAQKAGIQMLDVLVAVDGQTVESFASYDDVVNAVKGEEGTSVEITVMRQGQQMTFNITRGPVYNELIETEMMENGIGYVYISGFDKNADAEFDKKVDELIDNGAQALVFDVRFNMGGYLTVMVNMLDKILPQGTVISTTNKAGESTEYTSDENCLDIPIVVITNNYSISAAEFFAAVLQEYDYAEIVGDKTQGKGYAQNMFLLSDGSSVNISTERYYTPKGVSLAGVGITPDVEVSLPEEAYSNLGSLTVEQDTQLQEALRVANEKIAE